MNARLLTMDEVAERLRYDGRHAARAVRKLVTDLNAPHRRRGRCMLMTERDFRSLVELMECSS